MVESTPVKPITIHGVLREASHWAGKICDSPTFVCVLTHGFRVRVPNRIVAAPTAVPRNVHTAGESVFRQMANPATIKVAIKTIALSSDVLRRCLIEGMEEEILDLFMENS